MAIVCALSQITLQLRIFDGIWLNSLVVILVISAFITPPDPVSLILMSIPLMLLYELSIGVSWLVNRKKNN